MRLKPRLVVFDCDHTLWPFGVDNFFYKPPYKKERSGQVVDAQGQPMVPFPEVEDVFKKFKNENIELAAASRTTYPEGINLLFKLFDWDRYFRFKELYPGTKIPHFDQFKMKSGFNYSEMLFFDDEERNIVDIRPLGVTAILIDPSKGITMKVVENGLEQFVKNQRKLG